MEITQIIVALVIVIIAGIMIIRNKDNSDPRPEIKSMYVVQENDMGKVLATGTLTFDMEFCVAQSPAGGDEEWLLPNFVGDYAGDVLTWADCYLDNRKIRIEYQEVK